MCQILCLYSFLISIRGHGGICRFSATIDCVSKRNMFLVDKRNKINSTFSNGESQKQTIRKGWA